MAHINTVQLIVTATDLGYRAHQVQQDPAVQKACREASGDVATAANSIAKAGSEILAAWRRSGAGAAAESIRLST